MIYLYLDGDDIGLDIEKSFIENDEVSLKQINQEMNRIANSMSRYFTDADFSILFLGADGIICKGESIDISELVSYVRRISGKYTFSIGAGNNLRDAFLALRYAKSIGKNIDVFLEDGEFKVGMVS